MSGLMTFVLAEHLWSFCAPVLFSGAGCGVAHLTLQTPGAYEEGSCANCLHVIAGSCAAGSTCRQQLGSVPGCRLWAHFLEETCNMLPQRHFALAGDQRTKT
jgi:hypothetical protein